MSWRFLYVKFFSLLYSPTPFFFILYLSAYSIIFLWIVYIIYIFLILLFCYKMLLQIRHNTLCGLFYCYSLSIKLRWIKIHLKTYFYIDKTSVYAFSIFSSKSLSSILATSAIAPFIPFSLISSCSFTLCASSALV